MRANGSYQMLKVSLCAASLEAPGARALLLLVPSLAATIM